MGYLYITVVIICGFSIAGKFSYNLLYRLSAGFGIGVLISGWVSYIGSYIAKINGLYEPKVMGNIAAGIVMLVLIILTSSSTVNMPSRKEIMVFLFLFLAILTSMFYVFHIKDGILYSGATVYSDYAPNTALIRSFSYHDNFPTQYPHFGGEDIKYHFMFQYFIGNLEYMGVRIDIAYNLISTFSLWGFLVLLYIFVDKLTNSTAAGFLTVFLFFGRSSIAVFETLMGSIMSGSSFFRNDKFIGYTLHEDWGLWNYNVFLNQRHLGFGLLVMMIVLIYFLKYLSPRIQLIGKEAWIMNDWKLAAFMGLLLGSLAFWNGAVVIAALLILFGFALFSTNKLSYLITAVITVGLSLVQTSFFMNSGTKLTFKFGFLAEEKSIGGVFTYLLSLTGIYFIGILLLLFVLKGKIRTAAISFLLPVVFAFTVSMTPDITVNHKYVITAISLLNIIWAYGLVLMWEKTVFHKIFAVLLAVLLSATGIYDLITIYNADKEQVAINTNSVLTDWLKTNVTEDDLVLTGQETMSEVTLSGIMLYNGWPYYAWSAGYDTDTRSAKAIEIYTSQDPDKIKKLVKEEGIDYIVYSSDMTYDNISCSDVVISKIYDCLYNQNGYKIYKT